MVGGGWLAEEDGLRKREAKVGQNGEIAKGAGERSCGEDLHSEQISTDYDRL